MERSTSVSAEGASRLCDRETCCISAEKRTLTFCLDGITFPAGQMGRSVESVQLPLSCLSRGRRRANDHCRPKILQRAGRWTICDRRLVWVEDLARLT